MESHAAALRSCTVDILYGGQAAWMMRARGGLAIEV